MVRRTGACRIALVVLLLAIISPRPGHVAAVAVSARYTITELPVLAGSDFAAATDLTDAGEVVGTVWLTGGTTHAFRYARGALTDLGGLGGQNSTGAAINASGAIIGTDDAAGPVNYTDSFFLDGDTLAHVPFRLRALNDAGLAVGSKDLGFDSPQPRSFFYDHGTITPISVGPTDETMGGGFSAFAINNARQVLGSLYHDCPCPTTPILYQDGQTTDLTTRGIGGAVALNNRGQILGWATGGGAALFGDTTIPLPDTLGDYGVSYTDVNDLGQVVGTGYNNGFFPNNFHGMLYRDGILADLNALIPLGTGWVILRATAINNLGQILVAGTQADGYEHPLLLTPTFTDLPADHPYHDAILALANRDIIRGYGDGRVGPDDAVLRAQSAALIARSVGWDAEDWPDTTFSDQDVVDADLWRDVRALAHYHVALGYEDGTYNPTGAVLEQQVILYITRAMITKGYWIEQADASPYPNLPNTTDREQTDHRTVATYVHYVGAVPDRPTGRAWTDWNQAATRGWFAQALWLALSSQLA
jgi:probable HAF family extracellular repeat protein